MRRGRECGDTGPRGTVITYSHTPHSTLNTLIVLYHAAKFSITISALKGMLHLNNIARIAKRCPENISWIVKVSKCSY